MIIDLTSKDAKHPGPGWGAVTRYFHNKSSFNQYTPEFYQWLSKEHGITVHHHPISSIIESIELSDGTFIMLVMLFAGLEEDDY